MAALGERVLRVAMISYHTCPLATLGGKHTGGMNVYVRELARALGALQVQVDVFTRSENAQVPRILHDLGYGQRVIHVPAGPQQPLPKALWSRYLDAFTENVLDLVQRQGWRYDLVHSHYWLSGRVAAVLQRAWQVPWVHMYHTLAQLKPPLYRGEDDAERIAWEQRLALEAHQVVCATPAEQMFLNWHYRVPLERLVVIPPGVDLARFYPIPQQEARSYVGLDPEQRVLLYVGRFDPIKGLEVLFEAMARLRDRKVLPRGRTTLILIGGAQDEPHNRDLAYLRTLRDSRGLQDLITFIGPRAQDVLPYYYSAADVVVLPSHYESFGLVVLEAMACGRPVVASQVGGLLSLVRHGETGFLVPPQDPDALAGYLCLLLQDEDLRRRMGRCGVHHARRYHWQRVARRMADLYRHLVQAHGSRVARFPARPATDATM